MTMCGAQNTAHGIQNDGAWVSERRGGESDGVRRFTERVG